MNRWRSARSRGRGGGLIAVGAVLLGTVILLSMAAPLLAPFDPAMQQVGPILAGPSIEHWLGTDKFGRDVFSRVLWGGRMTILSCTVAMAGVVLFGSFMGALIAVIGNRIDAPVRGALDLLIAFPSIIVAMAFVGFFGPSLEVALLGTALVLWAPFARLSRSMVRSALAEPSAVAARALGSGRLRLLRFEAWPRARGSVAVLAAIETAQLISVVAGLSFLGLGAQPPSPEWGAMLKEGREALWAAPHLVLAPGISVLVTVLGIVLFAEGLRDRFDLKEKVVHV